MGKTYRKGPFRTSIGSDETVFNDPLIGIQGIFLSRYPYKEYHTNWDTPDKLNYQMITETGNLIQKILEIWDKDFIPSREFRGPLMRSRFGIQSPASQVNLNYDYFFYNVDGKRSLAELCADFEFNFDFIYDLFIKIGKEGFISRLSDFGKVQL